MKSVVKTSSFAIERNDYAFAKIGLFLRKTGLPFVVVVGICLLTIQCSEDTAWRTASYCVIGFMCLLEFCAIQVTVARIFGAKFRHIVDAKRTIELSDETVRVVTPGISEGEVSWSTFTSIETVRNWTFLMQEKTPVVAIPNSAFGSDEDLNAFSELIQRKRTEFKRKK